MSVFLERTDIVNKLDKSARNVVKLMLERSLSLGVAESCTGGLISGLLTAVPGSSGVFKLGICSYSKESKIKILGVSENILDNHGQVSAETALEMAKCVRSKLDLDIAVSTTGIAGPDGGSESKPVGTVYMGYSISGQAIANNLSGSVLLHQLLELKDKSRENIRLNTVLMVMEKLELLICNKY